MSKNHFEQLIEYVINDEDAKAKELFHQIVVSKSREIYENLMQEDNAMGEEPPMTDGNPPMEEGDEMGGSQSGDMIDDVQADESGMMEADDEDDMDGDDMDGDDMDGGDMDGDDMGGDDMGGDEPASKDDVMDLADKLDELMAEFENMMGGNDMGGDDMGGMDGGMSPEETDDDEFETEGMMENITLKQVHPKVTTHEQGDGKAGPVAFNAGQAGMEGRPVKTGQGNEGGHHDTAAYKNTTKDLIGKVGNTPAQAKQDLKPATKPHLGQATGVNTRTPFPRGK